MNTPRAVPDDIRRFVLSSVPSVPYLEAALLFHAEPSRRRSLQEVAAALYVTERAATELLDELCEAGVLVREDGVFSYGPNRPAVAQAFEALALLYPHNVVAISSLIHDATQKNAQRFADAFKLRKDR